MTSEPRYRAMNGKEIKEYLEIEQWKGRIVTVTETNAAKIIDVACRSTTR